MNPSELRWVDINSWNHLRHVNLYDATWGPDTEERQGACGNCGPQRGTVRIVAHFIADDLWRQDGGGIRSTGLAIARRTRWIGAIGRTRLSRGRVREWICRATPAAKCGSKAARSCATFCALISTDGGLASASGYPYRRRGGAAKAAVPRICARGFRLGATQRDAAAQSRARHVCKRFISTSPGSGSSHSQSEGRTSTTRVFATREFSARAVTRLHGRAHTPCDKSTSSDVLRGVALATALLLSPSLSAVCVPSFNPFRQDAAIV